MTVKEIRKYLATRKENKWYFWFPRHPKEFQSLVVEIDSAMAYDPKFVKTEGMKQLVCDEALRAYKRIERFL